MRILHFADIHFGMENYGRIDPKTGLHSRLGDFTKSFEAIVDYAIGEKDRDEPVNREGSVDLVLFAGDAFKTRDPSPTYQRAFAQGIRKIATAGIPVVMIVGNHDLPNAVGKANTLDIFPALEVPKVTLSIEPQYIKIETKAGPIQIVTLPWMYKSQFFAKEDLVGKTGEEINDLFQKMLIEKFRMQLSKIDSKFPAVAMVHATVEGATFGSERSVLLGSDIVIPLRLLTGQHLQYVAIGHIHRHQALWKDPMVMYSGSLERIDFGEEHEEKGFIVVEIDDKTLKTTTQFIKVPVRSFQTIHIKIAEHDNDPTMTVVHKVKKEIQPDAVVRVLIDVHESKAAAVREMPIREALSPAYFVAGIIKQVAREQRVSEQKGYSDDILSTSPIDTLEEYLKTKQVSPTRVQQLTEKAKELLEAVEQ